MQSTNKRYLVVYEESKDGYSAYVPDLPGCTSAGETREEIEENIIEAIKLHLEVLEEEGYLRPPAISYSEMLVIA